MMINLRSEEFLSKISTYIEKNKSRWITNGKLFDVYEGQIGHLLAEKMINDLGIEPYAQAKERKVPINVLKRILDKLSKIYQQEPKREVVDGTDADIKLVEKFEEMLDIDYKLNVNNELWNLYLSSLLHISIDDRKPFIRTIPNHKFLVYNTSLIDPTSPDVIILYMGRGKAELGESEVDIYWVFTDDEFAVYDSSPRLRVDLMNELEQDGSNPMGIKPFVYLNSSENLCMPPEQTDTLDMTLLIPLLLSDSNYIAKFTTYSILYGIDVDDSNMAIGPNVFWRFKSDADSDKNPSIGTVKPEGDIDKLLNLAMTNLSIWLNTKGIKPGSIGTLTTETAASGISKMIDEADVTEIRKFQASIYSSFETRFWDMLLNIIYPYWKEQDLIDDYGTFSPTAKVVVNFNDQTPLLNRGEQVTSLKEEVEAGFLTKERAIKMLNPAMLENEIQDLLKELEDEKEVEVIHANQEKANDTNTEEQDEN